MLLVGAGLLMRSFSQLTGVERGFDTRQRLFFSVSLPGSIPGPQRWQLAAQFLERVQALPYVKSAAVVSQRPLGQGNTGLGFGAPGQERADRDVPWASWRLISPDCFKALGMPILAGRTFIPQEGGNSRTEGPVVVSRRVADMLYPNQDPVGRPITLWKGQGNRPGRIIGVVADMRERGLDSEPSLAVYLPGARIGWQSWEYVVHTGITPMQAVPALRSILAEVNPALPLYGVSTMDDMVSRSVAPQHFVTFMLGMFAGLALLLALAGVYGVLSYWLNRRTAEIGLRAALGAGKRDILGVTISQGMKPVLVGVAGGLTGSVLLSGYLETLLFEIKAADFLTYVSGAGVVTLTALISCMLPALRAARIDPARALRNE